VSDSSAMILILALITRLDETQ